jgi:hypothetical protein
LEKKEKLKNDFDELFGYLDYHRIWDQMRVSLENLNPKGLVNDKESIR